MVKEKGLFHKDNIYLWVSIVIAGLFVYGKYFVATTELDKVYYALAAMLWIILGLMMTYLMKINKLLEEIRGKNV